MGAVIGRSAQEGNGDVVSKPARFHRSARDGQRTTYIGRLPRMLIAALVAASLVACAGAQSAERASRSGGPTSAGAGAISTIATSSTPSGSLSGSYLVDLTWVSDATGWALSAAPCGKALCARISRTQDGGRSWTQLPAPPAHLSGSSAATYCAVSPCVDHLRFATARIGYLFGPSLLITRDGGETWTAVASPPVESLEPGPGAVVRLVYDHDGCPGPCNRMVEAAAAGSDDWRVLVANLTAPSDADRAQIIRAGAGVIYVPIYGNLAAGAGTQQAVIYRSLDDGLSWTQLSDPCGGTGAALRDAISIAAGSGGFLAALCTTRVISTYGYSVVSSLDYGVSWGARRPVPVTPAFSPDLIAASGPNAMVITNSPAAGSGEYTYQLVLSTDRGRIWATVASDARQLDPNAPYATYLAFQGPLVGSWVGYPHAIWTTTDGGRLWTRRRFA
jgi:hypothetical protein